MEPGESIDENDDSEPNTPPIRRYCPAGTTTVPSFVDNPALAKTACGSAQHARIKFVVHEPALVLGASLSTKINDRRSDALFSTGARYSAGKIDWHSWKIYIKIV